jgi:hypothetical protein
VASELKDGVPEIVRATPREFGGNILDAGQRIGMSGLTVEKFDYCAFGHDKTLGATDFKDELTASR